MGRINRHGKYIYLLEEERRAILGLCYQYDFKNTREKKIITRVVEKINTIEK